MQIGTCHFVSRQAARRYYSAYGHTPSDIDRKIKVGEIKIGKPPLKAGETFTVIDDGTRYAIKEADEEADDPNHAML